MGEALRNDEKCIRSCILSDVIRQKSIQESYRGICDVIGNDGISYPDFEFWFYRFSEGEWDLDYDRSLAPKPLFTDLTVDVVEEITDYLEIRDQLKLRKVSRNVRTFVDKQKPNLWRLDFTIEHDAIFVEHNWSFEDMNREKKVLNVLYAAPGVIPNICRYDFLAFEFVRANDHVQRAIDDVGILLKNPKLELDSFLVMLNMNDKNDEEKAATFDVMKAFYEKLGRFMSSLNHKVSVKTLELTVGDQNDVMTILPFLEPGKLSQIIMKRDTEPINKNSMGNESIDKFVELEQWKQLEALRVNHWPWSSPFEHLIHLQHFNISLPSISVNDFIFLRDNLPNATNFKSCVLQSYNTPELYEIADELDLIVSYRDNSTHARYHYPIRDSEDVLQFFHRILFDTCILRVSWDQFQAVPV